MASLAGGGTEALGQPPPSRGYRPLSRSEGGTLTSLAVSLLDRMAHLKAQAEASPTTTFIVIKENRRGRKQMRAVAVTPSSVLNMRPRGAVAGIPNMKAFAGADASVLARSGVDVAKFTVSRSMAFVDILEATVDGDAVVLRLRNCAYEMRYHTPLATAVVRAVQTAQARAMELDKLELLFSELGLLGGSASAAGGSAGSSSGGKSSSNSGGASFSPASPDRESSRDRSRSRSKSTAGSLAGPRGSRLERERDAPASHSFALRALPMRLWSAAEVLTTARGSATAAALRATLQDAAAEAAAESAAADAAASGSAEAGAGGAAPAATGGPSAGGASSAVAVASRPPRKEPTEAEAEAERVASLAQSLLYDPATPEGRTRGKFVSRDFMTAVDETVTALQRAHGIVAGTGAGGSGAIPAGISSAAARLDPLARSVSMLKAMGPSAAATGHGAHVAAGSGGGVGGAGARPSVSLAAGKPPVRLAAVAEGSADGALPPCLRPGGARAFEDATAAGSPSLGPDDHGHGHGTRHADAGEAGEADNFSDDEEEDDATAATANSREGSVRALSISSAVLAPGALSSCGPAAGMGSLGADAVGENRGRESHASHSSQASVGGSSAGELALALGGGSSGSGNGSGSASCGHRPDTAQLPLFAALREVNALLVHYMVTRRRDMLGSVRSKLPWGATVSGDADPDGEVEAAELVAAERAAAEAAAAASAAVAVASDSAAVGAPAVPTAAAVAADATALDSAAGDDGGSVSLHGQAASGALSVIAAAAAAVGSHSRSTSAASDLTQMLQEAGARGLEMPPLAADTSSAGPHDAAAAADAGASHPSASAEAATHGRSASVGSIVSMSSTSSRDLPAGVVRVGRASVIAAHARRASERAVAAAAAEAAGAAVASASGSEGSGAAAPSTSAAASAAASSGAAFTEAELLACPWYVRQTVEDVAALLVESLAQPLTVRSVVQREVEASFWNVVTLRRAVADALRAVVDADAADSIAAKLRRLRASARPQSFFGIPPHLEAADGWASAAMELRDADRHACPREKMDALLGAVRSIYKSHARAHAAAIMISAAAGSAPADRSAGAACAGAQGHGSCPRHSGATSLPQHSARVTVLAERLPALGADEFLPIFLYTLVSSSLADPASLNELLWATMDEADLRSHGGYYLTVLEAALEYIAALPEGP